MSPVGAANPQFRDGSRGPEHEADDSSPAAPEGVVRHYPAVAKFGRSSSNVRVRAAEAGELSVPPIFARCEKNFREEEPDPPTACGFFEPFVAMRVEGAHEARPEETPWQGKRPSAS